MVLLAGANVIVMLPTPAAAVGGDCWFTTRNGPVTGTGNCGVSGYGDYGTNDVLTGRSSSGGGYAIPLSVNTKGEFINFIKNRFNNGSTHNRIGAAFIMQTLRGDHGWPTSNDVADWVRRMNDPDVTVVGNRIDNNVGRTSWYDAGKHNTFFAYHPAARRHVVNIYYKGRLDAQVEHECGNMVAGPIVLPKPFDLTGSTSVNRTTASPGQTVTWTHTIRNAGPGPTTNSGHYGVWTGSTPGRTRSGNYNDDFANSRPVGRTKTIRQSYTVRSGDVGETFCQYLTYRPTSSTNNGSSSTAQRCVRITADFNLTPVLNGQSGNVPAGDTVDTVKGSVQKVGRNSDTANWVFGKMIVPPGVGIPGSGGVTQSTDSSATRYRDPGAGRTWTRLDDGSRTFSSSTTQVATDPTPTIGSGLEPGTRVCWTLAVKPPNGTYNGWRFAKPLCITVMPIPMRPTAQLQGYDGRFGGKAVTSLTTVSGKTYGSWSEYGSLSSSQNFGFASGAGLSGGSSSANQSSWSNLTFANDQQTDCSSALYGCYGYVEYPDAMVTALKARCTENHSNDHTIPSKSGVSGTHVICVDGTATVSGNITYDSGTTSKPNQLPQLVIIATDILVKKRVSHIDGWLIATPKVDEVTGAKTGGRISTCYEVTDASGGHFPSFAQIDGGLKESTCPNSLTIDGPVVADSLYLFRTTDPDKKGKPAEVFNLRADAFLWAFSGGVSSGGAVAQTESLRPAPPRF